MKHKKLTMIVALVLVAALAAGLGIWATGEANIPTVTYYDGSDGNGARFTFTHTGDGSDTNLFPNFSNCMPGDSLTQTIRVQADGKNGVQGAKIYLRAEIDGDASAKEGSAISYNDVLDHIGMTVSKDGVVIASNKTAKLFSQLDAADGLKSNVFIAEVSPKTDPVDLDVTIEVDPAMGNAFQEAAAHVAFVFSVEDNEVPPPPLEREKHDAYIVGYPNGNVEPNGNITRAEVATIFFRLLTEEVRTANSTQSNSLSDVTRGQWFNHAVSTLSSMGIVKGHNDGTFAPNAPITRAEFAAIAARFDDKNTDTSSKFTDIASHWAKNEIGIAANKGWINGYPDGTFRPNQYITRAEAMTLVNRVLNRLPENSSDLLDSMIKWPDNSDASAWYYLAVQEATNSHAYSDKSKDDKYEKWTTIRDARDWTELEK